MFVSHENSGNGGVGLYFVVKAIQSVVYHYKNDL
jgi:hypothetical protein